MTEQVQWSDHRVHVPALLNRLFDDALKADEFEYCCTLLRIRGEEPLTWDPLGESAELIQQIASLVHTPLVDSLRLRLLLFLYCHVTEMHDLYAIPMNLLRIVEGGRYSVFPFNQGSGSEPRSPAGKAEAVSNLARQLGYTDLADLYDWMLVRAIRNAFFHSDYSIRGSKFVIYSGRGVVINNTVHNVVPWEWLVPRLEAGINLGLGTIHQLLDRRGAYREEKVIRPGRAHGFEEVTLLVDDSGLIGFKG